MIRRIAAKVLMTGGLLLPLAVGCQLPTLNTVILRPSLKMVGTPADLGYTYEEVRLNVADDPQREIVIWYVHSDESRGLLVLVPGSDANKSRYTEGLPIFVPNGYDCILMDYEGFGDSPGTPTLQAVVDDAFAVTDYALTRHEQVVLFGVSVGTPAVARVAAERELTGCTFEGTLILAQEAELWLRDNLPALNFLQLWHAANFWMYPQIPADLDTLKYLALVDEPKLFLHSIEDEVTPYAGGQLAFETAPEPKQFWEMRGGHGKMVRLDTAAYTARHLQFFNEVAGYTARAGASDLTELDPPPAREVRSEK